MMSLLLSNQECWRGDKLNCISFKKRSVIFLPAANNAGKRILNRKEKRKSTCLTGSANFFWRACISKLLSSVYSCLRLVKDFMKILWSAGGWMRLNIVKPKNGLATSSNTAKYKYMPTDLNIWFWAFNIIIDYKYHAKFNNNRLQIVW